MPLHLVLGPMKAQKTLDLAKWALPLQYENVSYGIFHPHQNVRDDDDCIHSRCGVDIPAIKIKSLFEIADLDVCPERIGIDEIHMFPPSDAEVVEQFLLEDRTVLAVGLNLDYRGKMFEIVHRLLELGPESVKYNRATCEICRDGNKAVYTQVYECGKAITSGYPSIIPEGTQDLIYKAVCRHCFERARS